MRKPTISELRENQKNRLASDLDIRYDEASRIINLFYRLAFQRETEVIIDNDAMLYSPARSEREAQETEKRHNRLKKALAPYNLSIRYYGIYPTIYDDNAGRDYDIDCYMYERRGF